MTVEVLRERDDVYEGPWPHQPATGSTSPRSTLRPVVIGAKPLGWGLSRYAVVLSIASAAAFVVAFLATFTGYIPLRRIWGSKEARPVAQEGYRATGAHVDGEQLVLIYFGSSRCVWSNSRELPEIVERLKVAMERQASRRGWSFESVGVGVDWIPEDGLDHLRKFGRFDEVSSGYGWGNHTAMTYFNGQPVPLASTPEVVVVRRNLRRPSLVEGVANYAVAHGQVVVVKSGLTELQRWAEAGAPLPPLPSRMW